jgi:hypothetical protein
VDLRVLQVHLADHQPAAVQLHLVVVEHGRRGGEERAVRRVAAADQLQVADRDPAEDPHPGRPDVDLDPVELLVQGGDHLLADPLRADPRVGHPPEGGEDRHPGQDQPADQPVPDT